jgi:RNA polymerase-associated protein
MALRSRKTENKPAPTAGLTLYVDMQDPISTWVRIILNEKDIDDVRVVAVSTKAPNEDLTIINPSQTLPTLADRDVVVIGAREIAEYLDERYPYPRLLPMDPANKARIRMTLTRIHQELFPAVRELQAGKLEAARILLETFVAGIKLFPAHRSGYLGVDYSQADIAWLVVWHALVRAKIPRLEVLDAMQRYSERLSARPAVASVLT